MADAESVLFREEIIPGKGIGCIAIQDIAKGSLVLRELPLLFLSEQMTNHAVIQSFIRMSRDDQERYTGLHNIFEVDSDNWSEGMKNEYRAAMLATNGMTFSEISVDRAFKAWGIFKTNTFSDGVYLKMSRVNHSCQPNAEIFKNQDTNNTTDLRALRTI